jgi:soluble lytic murein transglycosylase-like protein
MICSMITTVAMALQISSATLGNLVFLESSGNPKAVSSAGAMGLTQITPIAIEDVKRNISALPPICQAVSEEPRWFDEEWNLIGGACYYAYLRSLFPKRKALAAYNTGMGNVMKGKIPTITHVYVERVMTGTYYRKELQDVCSKNRG